MSRSVVNAKTKARKKQNAVKKANRKRLFIISVCVLVLAAAAGITFFVRNQNSGAEIYSLGGQSVQLFSNGTYTARLAHNSNAGTYTKTAEGHRTLIIFNTRGEETNGYIENNLLYLPDEWDDGHGHGMIFQRVK